MPPPGERGELWLAASSGRCTGTADDGRGSWLPADDDFIFLLSVLGERNKEGGREVMDGAASYVGHVGESTLVS